jgi:hypothetical protein
LLWVDSTTKKLVSLDDAGRPNGLLSRNDATASQGAGFAADTYVTNSGILIPSTGMKVGQLYKWEISLSKTAAGTAAAVVTVRVGSNQSTADTSRLALTQGVAQAANAVSALLTCFVGVRSVSASGVIAGGFGFTQSYGTTAGTQGFGNGADGASAGFDNSALAGQYVGLSINGGASAAWTITHCAAYLIG